MNRVKMPIKRQKNLLTSRTIKNKVQVSIIIVTYNSEKYIKQCLDSVKKQIPKNFEVILIDNNSQDQTKKIIKNYKFIKFIENKDNLGFSKSNNQGIEIAKGDYIFLLNPDVILPRNCLTHLVESLKQIPKAAFVVPKLLKPQKKQVLDSTGIIATSGRRFLDRGRGELDGHQYDKFIRIFGGCAAALLLRKKALETIKIEREYLDEDFFAYFEDVDLCWRLRLLGWQGYYLPQIIAYHARGHDLKPFSNQNFFSFINQRYSLNEKNYSFKQIRRHSFRNSIWILLKNDSPYELLLNFLPFFAYWVKRIGYAFLVEPYVLKELPHLFKGMPAMLKKRKFIQRTKIIEHKDLRTFFET